MVIRREAKQYFLGKAIIGCNIWRFAYFFKHKHITTIKAGNKIGITKAITYKKKGSLIRHQ
jgi:hypothetical protein